MSSWEGRKLFKLILSFFRWRNFSFFSLGSYSHPNSLLFREIVSWLIWKAMFWGWFDIDSPVKHIFPLSELVCGQINIQTQLTFIIYIIICRRHARWLIAYIFQQSYMTCLLKPAPQRANLSFGARELHARSWDHMAGKWQDWAGVHLESTLFSCLHTGTLLFSF